MARDVDVIESPLGVVKIDTLRCDTCAKTRREGASVVDWWRVEPASRTTTMPDELHFCSSRCAAVWFRLRA
jgi:hypothetical protein